MAVVYAATHRNGKRVAIKMLHQEHARAHDTRTRFLREGYLANAVDHEGVVSVIDDDVTSDGSVFLVMELLDGETVERRWERKVRRIPLPEVLAIASGLLDVLGAAHAKGVVHRDIKPENLLLDKAGQVKIADFGIAKMLHLPGNLSLTGTMDVVGTPLYMAPEQIENPQIVDSRADIYSLGVVFYEMLTGELPLGKFQPPSQKFEADPRLDEVVIHALEKEPDRRYQQVGQMKADVEKIAQTMPTPEDAGPKTDTVPPSRSARPAGLVAEAQTAARAALLPRPVRRTSKAAPVFRPKIVIAAGVIAILAALLLAILLLTVHK
jgi:serine/threonine protein kinase